MANLSVDDCYVFCRYINSMFNCPPPPKSYCGQFDHVPALWETYGEDVTLRGNIWSYKDTHSLSFMGGRFFNCWPVYELSAFLVRLDLCIKGEPEFVSMERLRKQYG